MRGLCGWFCVSLMKGTNHNSVKFQPKTHEVGKGNMTNQELREILLLSKKIENAILRVINNSESLSPGEKTRVGEMIVNRRHWSTVTVFSRLPKAQRDEVDSLIELLSDTIDIISR